jgi:hypothetical protein
MNKTYLGDGVYVSIGDYGLVLTTEDGLSTTNTIYLEPNVLESLEEYIREWRKGG